MFYVYQLVDPRDGKPFYIGKGTGNRISAHEREAEKGKSSHKCNKIRAIKAAGLVVTSEIVRSFKSENAAYRFEAHLIKKIGLENLTNVEAGGRGGFRGAQKKNESKRELKMLAEVLARLMLSMKKDNRCIVHGLDLTKQLGRFLDAAITEHGLPKVAKLVRPYGVELVGSTA